MPETYNVVGTSDSLFEGMTKQQIYTAIVEAVEGGTVGDIDTGFVTIIKEINKNVAIRFWVGTTAEYNALQDKPTNVLYIKTDDTSATDINTAITNVQNALSTIEGTITTMDDDIGTLKGKASKFQFLGTLAESTTLSSIFTQYENASYLSYSISSITTTDIYPTTFTYPTGNSNYAVVVMEKVGNTAKFTFTYSGDTWTTSVYGSSGGVSVDPWKKLS
ncbi:MAG: hypothetical protein II685_08340 [Clostridia bacterium]|nr:hypothetical protein [Clostridia bacterium]